VRRSTLIAVAALPGVVSLTLAFSKPRDSGRDRILLRDLHGNAAAEYLSKQAIEGDWIAVADITRAGSPAEADFLFAYQANEAHLRLHLTQDRSELIRQTGGDLQVLDAFSGAGPLPWVVSVMRRGAYYVFRSNGTYLGYTFHPSGNVEGGGTDRPVIEPSSSKLGVAFPASGPHSLRSLSVESIVLGDRTGGPVFVPGAKDSWYGAEIFPGAMLAHDGTYYFYINGTDWTSEKLEGGGNTRAGLATSSNLREWKINPSGPILKLGPAGSWDSTLVMINGAMVMPDGRFAVTYMGFNGKTWSGIGLATADHPWGPFTKYADNPVMRAEPGTYKQIIHEHTLLRVDDHYVLMYVGFDGKTGDRGCLATSRDLIHWQEDPANPVFVTEGGDRFDSLHLRPRSLFRHGDYYYLFYEGAGRRRRFSSSEGGVRSGEFLVFDTIGLARSKDLHHWERHPWNPAIAQSGGREFDSLWTGWPMAVPQPDGVMVFYAASDAWGFAKKQGRVFAGLMRFPYRQLERWPAN
jgi:hypothetical protein